MKKLLRPNPVILFQGDSITDCGRKKDEPAAKPATDLGQGYPAKIAAVTEILRPGCGVRFINRGISGNRVIDLLGRYEKDFKALKPDLVSILIGINDTWRRYDKNDPTSSEIFGESYRTLLENIKRDLPDAIIVIMEPFLLDSVPERRVWREDLDPKVQIVRRLAKEYADCFIPMDGIFVRYAAQGYKDTDMAGDGVHPTPFGHGIIAAEWLRSLETAGLGW
ncbi:MAG: SGNH/GDSL hydrolase family protein [Treponema sp.]|nr:SGNH/GDSL hydrolase family protein [Treponema sp.]